MSQTIPVVYVVHEPLKRVVTAGGGSEWVRLHDVTGARSYGHLEYVYPAGRLSPDPELYVKTARARLENFTSNDYLLLSGDITAIAVAAVVAANNLPRGQGKLKMLVWDKRLSEYHVIAPQLWDDEDAEEVEF